MSGKGAKGLSGKGAKGTMGKEKGDKKKPTSRSARAGLQFPVGRIHRLLKVRAGRLPRPAAAPIGRSGSPASAGLRARPGRPLTGPPSRSAGPRDCQWPCGSHRSRLHSSHSR